MIIAKNKIITSDVAFCRYNPNTHKYDIQFKGGKIYSYNYKSVKWLKHPKKLDPAFYQISHNKIIYSYISELYLFKSSNEKYLHICFENNSERDFPVSELDINESCLSNKDANDTFEYLKKIADMNSLKSENGTKLLSKQYEKLSFIKKGSILSSYLNPRKFRIYMNSKEAIPIFPFGFNSSQYKAVKLALESNVSIIEGPPGTGKTQTILNIIANLLINDKTVQVVSNNNSATENILEKLSRPENGLGFLVAQLGNAKNKSEFIENQTGKYPDISSWQSESLNKNEFFDEIKKRSEKLNLIYEIREQLAVLRNEFKNLETEEKHFDSYFENNGFDLDNYKISKNIKSERIMKLWQEYEAKIAKGTVFLSIFKIKAFLVSRFFDRDFFEKSNDEILAHFQKIYYIAKKNEIKKDIQILEKKDRKIESNEIKDFNDLSMLYLKNFIYTKYGNKQKRRIFSENDFYKNAKEIKKEYPIVLSATFSAISSFNAKEKFDYLIMDEASQVDIATGALALACAKNVVIVGDQKQLPNVLTQKDKNLAEYIFRSCNVDEKYNFAHYSFLKSVLLAFPDAPHTLLKEHYRCHPKIINFCNKKFYGGNLVIMTQDNNEKNVLSVIKTVKGNHERNHINQRQIDVICEEVLPAIQSSACETGIISPYNNQVNEIKKYLMQSEEYKDVEVATVHKFQGKEKDTIIITTVDNEITEFTDDPYLLNVAVSRAKKHLILVISGNEQPKDNNIGALISYIEYNNFSVTESNIRSVFDYLYTQYTESRMLYLKRHKKISEYDSENLMFSLISDVLKRNNWTSIGIAVHHPLSLLLANTDLLDDEERRYAMNSGTHLDFLVYSKISKKPILVIEVDGYKYHKEGTVQSKRDDIKNRILQKYGLPYLRFATNGSGEKEKFERTLKDILN